MRVPTWLIVTVMIISFFSVNIMLMLFCAVWLLLRWASTPSELDEYYEANRDFLDGTNTKKSKHTRKETGFAVYRIYGSNRTYLGTWSAPNMAISNAESALRRSSKNTSVIVTDKETGGTIWSDNK